MTLGGTNTYLYGAAPCLVIDPGPDDETHLDAVRSAAERRGGLGAVLLTHSHADHAAGAPGLGTEVIVPAPGEVRGGLRALATPGHATDHVCLISDDGVCFSGDLVLGVGFSIVPPDGGSLAAYMQSLEVLQAEEVELICPGHGPWIADPAKKLCEYVEHRTMRERRLLAALDRGERSRDALLAEVWDDVSAELRPVAELTMQAHLSKLAAEGRLPEGIA